MAPQPPPSLGHWVSSHCFLQEGQRPPVSKVFHWCPQVHIHQARPSGFQSHFGQRISTDLGMGLSFGFKNADRISLLNCSAADYTCRHSTVTTHGGIASVAQVFFHSGAGVAIAGDFEDDFSTNLYLLFHEGEQVDAGYDEVAAGKAGINGRLIQNSPDSLQVFCLNEGDLPFSTFAAVMVAYNAFIQSNGGGRARDQRAFLFRAFANPVQTAGLWNVLLKVFKRRKLHGYWLLLLFQPARHP